MNQRTAGVDGMAGIAVLSAVAWMNVVGADTVQVTTFELSSDFSFGYQTGVKQIHGVYRDGLSLHQISRADLDSGHPRPGNPDFIFFVDEDASTSGFVSEPTGDVVEWVVNPGGMIDIDEDGFIWYLYGGRVQDLAPSFYKSTEPRNPASFDIVMEDFVTEPRGSTTFLFHAPGPYAHFFWRESMSNRTFVNVHYRRYDQNAGFGVPDIDLDLAEGMTHQTLGAVGVEQLWSRYDPLFGYLFITWQWFDREPRLFGSNPFLYSDDQGLTWRRADGVAISEFPLQYDDTDSTLTPFDHLVHERTTLWYPREIGVAPEGTFWMQNPTDSFGVDHIWWDVDHWERQRVTGTQVSKSSACGATKDYLALVYSDEDNPNLLHLKYSRDGGRSWIGPIVVDELDPSHPDGERHFAWVSFVQPVESYEDNVARFFYGYFREPNGLTGRRFRNNIRFAKITLPDPGELATLTGVTVTFGSLVSGGVTALEASDNTYLQVGSQFGFSANEPNLTEFIVDASSPVVDPTLLDLVIETRVDNPGGVQTISMFDWVANRFEPVLQGAVARTDERSAARKLDAMQFVESGSGAMRASVRQSVVATFSAAGFQSHTDEFAMIVR